MSEGSTLMYYCKDTLLCDTEIISGIPTSLCYSNGSWTPNPDKFHCRSKFNSNTPGLNLNTTSIIIIVVVAAVFPFIGFVIGWLCHNCKVSAQARSKENFCTRQAQPSPLYEELHLKVLTEDQNKLFELKENVAYGPVEPT